jgi:hypothetical protein
MADIALPTTAVPGDGAYAIPGKANAALAQSKVVYRNTSKKYALAQANSATTASAVGVTQNGVGAANGKIMIQTTGRLTGLSGLSTGTLYVLSATTAGSIMPYDDLASGNRVVIIGYAVSATELELLVHDTGVAFA